MPHVFVNYRTGDGEQAATTIARDLTHRFGPGPVFRASESIRPGQLYPEELLAGVRRSDALLALIGPHWLDAPDSTRPGRRALDNAEDWVRKEILEAFSRGLPVIPVLLGRRTERLTAAALPRPLVRLAYTQSLRYDHQQASTDLARIAEVLTDLVPGLAEPESPEQPGDPASGAVTNTMDGDGDSRIQARDVSGGLTSTVIHDSHGPVNTGSGPQHVHQPHIDGDGATYIGGDNKGSVKHRFGER
ncbi:toll/interleukin-1 receptor domain-containing protein [Streptomyces smyrnaeus]|uniref:Toll/interleukin-1 receptor domain-containing protein n=1 Tax=Streptomyces smyrnaeus TaxID=1387713 RepID=A0ABS3XWZ1_9ACTN|nr:toll/interleukin-1 receptor domain-containing protein [Streptomyces smyrnaeus]MBO8199923.1 toll/interleukin-1 receptor domain-containing protein [Streptomyces smyrnaeus]